MKLKNFQEQPIFDGGIYNVPPALAVDKIIAVNARIAEFWKNSSGWAPQNVEEILCAAKLEWQHSLSISLKRWCLLDQPTDGDLILAWTNLGALVEGALKLFFCVYLNDYLNDDLEEKPRTKRGETKIPNSFTFEELRQYVQKIQLCKTHPKIYEDTKGRKSEFTLGKTSKSLLLGQNDYGLFINTVQQNRNAIHAFKPREIGTFAEFKECVEIYWDFLKEIDSSLPYPQM